MKKKLLVLLTGILLIGSNVFAADGDFIVEGNVGIGTSSPGTQLHVENPSGNASSQLTSSTSGTSYVNMGDTADPDAGQVSYINDSDAMAFSAGAAERMRITSTGNVGIGTNTPNATLDVAGDLIVDDALTIGIDSPDVSGFKFDMKAQSLLFGASDTGERQGDPTFDDTMRAFLSYPHQLDKSKEVVLMSLIGAGNNAVTFGGSKLGAKGATIVSFVTFPTINTEASAANSLQHLGFNGPNSLTTFNGRKLDLDTIFKGTTGEFVRFDSSSERVGIGTTTPTAKLDVNSSTGYDQLRLRQSYTPTGTADTNGNAGDVSWDDGYVYVRTSAGWKRAQLSTW